MPSLVLFFPCMSCTLAVVPRPLRCHVSLEHSCTMSHSAGPSFPHACVGRVSTPVSVVVSFPLYSSLHHCISFDSRTINSLLYFLSTQHLECTYLLYTCLRHTRTRPSTQPGDGNSVSKPTRLNIRNGRDQTVHPLRYIDWQRKIRIALCMLSVP